MFLNKNHLIDYLFDAGINLPTSNLKTSLILFLTVLSIIFYIQRLSKYESCCDYFVKKNYNWLISKLHCYNIKSETCIEKVKSLCLKYSG